MDVLSRVLLQLVLVFIWCMDVLSRVLLHFDRECWPKEK